MARAVENQPAELSFLRRALVEHFLLEKLSKCCLLSCLLPHPLMEHFLPLTPQHLLLDVKAVALDISVILLQLRHGRPWL